MKKIISTIISVCLIAVGQPVRVYAGIPDIATIIVTPSTAITSWTNQDAICNFSVQDYKVISRSSTGGTIELSTSRAKATDTVIVTARPANGFAIEEVFVNGASIGTKGSFEMPARNTEVTAKFKPSILEIYPPGAMKGYYTTRKGGSSAFNGGTRFDFPKGVYKTATIEMNVSVVNQLGKEVIIAGVTDRNTGYFSGRQEFEFLSLSSGNYNGTITKTIDLRPDHNYLWIGFAVVDTSLVSFVSESTATFSSVKITLRG